MENENLIARNVKHKNDNVKHKKKNRSNKKLIGFLSIGLIIGILFGCIYYLIHPIAMFTMNNVKMNLISMKLSNPKDEKIEMESVLNVNSNSILTVYVNSWNATIEYDGFGVAEFQVPAMKLGQSKLEQLYKDVDGRQKIHIPKTWLYIQNMSAWNSFATDMVASESLRWRMKGKIEIHR